jgi:hypothetical protein
VTGADREQLRAEILAAIPPWYSPWLHLALPASAALAVAWAALSELEDVRAWQLACLPLLALGANAGEWHAHRGVMHRRTKLLEAFYRWHTPVHHAVFAPGDMAVRAPRELWLVLLPALALPVLLAVAAPIAALLAVLGGRNLGLLWLALVMLQFGAHEAIHLACHLPARGWPARLMPLSALRRHHEHHHAPRAVARCNFNVTLPLWDVFRGTTWRPRPVPAGVPARRRA